MARIDEYRKHIERLLSEYGNFKPRYGELEVQKVIDRENDHYHLLTVGWQGDERVRGTILHLDIKSGKIWIQHDGTEYGVANDLVEWGVPKEDIVLAFYEPSHRELTEFAKG